MAEPAYSMTWPVPPPIPILAMTARMTSLAVTPGCSSPSTRTQHRLRLALEQRLGGEDHLDLARPDAEGERPEGAVSGGVRVAADDRHARLRQAQLRPDDVDDPLAGRALAVERDPELLAVQLDLAQLVAGQLVGDGERRVERGDRMVGGGDGLVGAADLDATLAQAGERLRAGDLVDEMKVDREDGRRAGVGGHDVASPRSSRRWCAVGSPWPCSRYGYPASRGRGKVRG